MKRPQHFERLVVCCMSGILLTVWCIGALGYLAFGNDVEVRASVDPCWLCMYVLRPFLPID